MIAFLTLVARERLAVLRRGGLVAAAVRAFGVAGIALIVGPTGLGLAMLSSRIADPRAHTAVVALVVMLLFLLWLVAGIVFGAPLSMTIDLRSARSFPLRFQTLYAASVFCGLLGLWLVYVAPPLVWFALDGGVTALLAIFVFALINARIVSIFGRVTSSLTRGWRRPLLLWLAFVAGNALVFMVMYHRTAIDLATIVRWELATRFRFTPPGALTNALSGDVGQPFAVLAFWLVALSILDYEALYRQLYVTGGGEGAAGRSSRFLRIASRPDANAALLAREIVVLLRLRPFRMVYLFGLSYFLVYPLMIPADELNTQFMVVLGAMPFLFFGAAAGNVLGIDYRSIREMFALPLDARQIVQTKMHATLILVFSLEAVLFGAVVLTGKLNGDVLFLFAFLAGLAAVHLGCGSAASCLFPHPVDLRRQYAVGNDAGSTLTFIAVVVWTVSSLAIATFTTLSGVTELLLAALAWMLHVRVTPAFIARRLDARRDAVLDRLTNFGRTA